MKSRNIILIFVILLIANISFAQPLEIKENVIILPLKWFLLL